MAVEVKQVLESEFNVFFTPQDLKTMTFADLYRMKEEIEKAPKSSMYLLRMRKYFSNLKILYNTYLDGKKLTQYQMIMDEKFINMPIVRIPFIGDELNEEISVRDNPTVFVFPGFVGLLRNYSAVQCTYSRPKPA